MTTIIIIALLLLSSFLFFGLAVISWLRRDNPGAFALFALMIACGIYSLGYCIEIQGSTIQHIYACLRFEYFGISFISALWLIFCIEYAGKHNWLTPFTLALIFSIPIITLILVNTNNYHHLYYRSISIVIQDGLSIAHLDKGPWYWVQATYLNLSLLLGGIMLLILGIQAPASYRRQYIFIFLASLFPWIGLSIYLVGISPIALDLNPFALVFTGIICALTMFRYRLFDLIPIARAIVFETMQDGVLLIDRYNRILDLNKSMISMFNLKTEVIGKTIGASFMEWPDLTRQFINKENISFDLQVTVDDKSKWLAGQVSPILHSKGHPGGRLVMLRDITEYKEIEARLEETNNELQQLSIRDSLTNLFNRRYMEEALEQEINRVERNTDYLAMLMMDIDYFKQFNDQHGHLAGDMALREVSRVINQNVRIGDIVCRYGGEEFILIMPGSSLQAAVQRAEILREKIQDMSLQVNEDTIERITISIGIAICPEHAKSSEDLLRAADMAMYDAKQAGRNRVRIFNTV
jgi:diguanylate cyclase (GGDEF)-like protein/PAS domain S-box-containing protein